ncbi:MAG: PGF-CTERM sorting domain-containing protein [Halobacteriota archaeon]
MRIKTWAILVVVLLALPTLVWAQGGADERTSEWVRVSADPAVIPADGNTTSKIEVMVVWPKETEDAGEPMVNESVNVQTSLGWLREAGNESNTGTTISLTTDENGTATALLAGNKTVLAGNKTAEIKVWMLTDRGWNDTEVRFQEPEAAAATTTPSPAVNETPTAIPGPTGATPAINETPTAAPGPMGATPAVNETPTAATPGPTETIPTTPGPTPTAKPSVPGFGAVFAIAGLFAVAYLVRRERRRG